MEDKLLEKIESPQDIKNLSVKELENLSDEIRQEIVSVVSKNGGHLSPNLGVVELTVALHKVFDSPRIRLFLMLGINAMHIKCLQADISRWILCVKRADFQVFPHT